MSGRKWSDAEVFCLINFRDGGKSFAQIGNVLRRTKNSCLCKYDRLRKQGKILKGES